MANVFVSHRSADTSAATRLAEDLRLLGHSVWLDTWELLTGDSIVQAINSGLTGAEVLVLCLSDEGVMSPWMSREWLSALARQLNGENITLLPVRLTGGTPPAIIADLKCADAVSDYHRAVADLNTAIAAVRGSTKIY